MLNYPTRSPGTATDMWPPHSPGEPVYWRRATLVLPSRSCSSVWPSRTKILLPLPCLSRGGLR